MNTYQFSYVYEYYIYIESVICPISNYLKKLK